MPIFEARVGAFLGQKTDKQLDIEMLARFFWGLAAEYKSHFQSNAKCKELIEGFKGLHPPPKPKTSGDVIYILVNGNRLVHKTAFTCNGKKLGSTLGVWKDNPFYDMHLPCLADILFLLNKILHISKEGSNGVEEELLGDKFQEIIASCALQALLYYPVAHCEVAKYHEASLAIATVWMDVLFMRFPARPLAWHVQWGNSPYFQMNIDAGHNEDQTTL